MDLFNPPPQFNYTIMEDLDIVNLDNPYLQIVWEDILELEWPLRRADIKTKSKTGRGYTPPDNIILEWAEALKHIRDPYLRLIWLCIIQHGWRPTHIGGIRWKHIQRDQANNPISLVAFPENGEFKTDQPVGVHLSPEVVDTIKQWEKETIKIRGQLLPEDYIIPWRSRSQDNKLDWSRPFDSVQNGRIWSDFRRLLKLPKLTPRDCRHWVATACRKAGLSKAATAYLQGHDSSGGSTMRDWYDHISE